MDTSFPECDQFVHRERERCRDETGDLRGDNRWRARRGLAPVGNADASPSDDALTTKRPQAHIRLCNKRRGSSSTRGKPGTVFKRLADSLNVEAPEGCNCEAVRADMDALGVEGCRRQRSQLLRRIRANARKVSWLGKAVAVGSAVTSGLAFSLNPLDPLGSLFDEALRQAEAEAATETTQPIS